MTTLLQSAPIGRLSPMTHNVNLCDRLLTALVQAQSYALAGNREPFRALNYRGTMAWQEAINEVGKVLSDYGWKYNRRSQPTYTAPASLFPFATELFLYHGKLIGNEIQKANCGPQTRVKIEANALQLVLDLQIDQVAPDGVISLSLVMEVTDNDNLNVYLALGREVEENRVVCDEIVLLNDHPLALDQPTLEIGGPQPEAMPVVPLLSDLDETG